MGIDLDKKPSVAKISMREAADGESVCLTNSIMVTVGGVEISVNEVDIHKMDCGGIIMATITLPVTLGN